MSTAAASLAAMRPALLRLFSITGLVAVSSMYYHQAMLAVLANELSIPPERVGWIPTATWSGYALGILLFVPLGDRLELRRITLAKLACLACALLAAATAPNYYVLIAASVFIGLFTSVVQDIVPYGAHLAAPEERTHVIATISSGILLGNLLGRLAGGVVADFVSWRATFACAALGILILWPVLRAKLPERPPTSKLGYFALVASILGLARRYPALVRASVTQMSLFAAYGALWATVARMFESDLGLAASATGLLGIPASIGAFVLPQIAKMVPRYGKRPLMAVGIVLTMLPFLAMGLFGVSLAGVIVAVMVMDIGLRFCLAPVQAIIFSLEPGAHSRINTFYITTLFAGQSVGSFAASAAWLAGGWQAVCFTAAGITLVGAVVQAIWKD